MICAPTKRQATAITRNFRPAQPDLGITGGNKNDWPCIVPNNSPTKNSTPSVPITNPTRLAPIIINTFPTAPSAATCLYHTLCPYYIQNICQKWEFRTDLSSSINNNYEYVRNSGKTVMTGEGIDSSMLTGRMKRTKEETTSVSRRSYQITPGDGYGIKNKHLPYNQRRCRGSHYPCQDWQIHKPWSEATYQREPSSKESKVGSTTYLCRRDEPASQQFRYNEQTNKPSPSEQPKGQVMPKRNERKHQYGVDNRALCPTKGHVNVPARS